MSAVETLVMACDQKYLYPMIHTLYSAKSTTDKNFKFLFAYDPTKVDEAGVEVVREFCNLMAIPFDLFPVTLEAGLPTVFHISATTYAKLLVADTFQKPFLYLDCDLLCFPGWDWLLLDRFPMPERFSAMACPEDVTNYANSNNEAVKAAGSGYFNAGVLVINSPLWQAQKLNEKWREVVSRYEELHFDYADQCVLNYMLAGKYLSFSASFNRTFMNTTNEDGEDTFIYQFIGSNKPWHFEYRNTYKQYIFNAYFESERQFLELTKDLKYRGMVSMEELRELA